MIGSIAPIAQLVWQPFSSILIVKVPHRILMPCLVLGWGIAQACMAACTSYSGLLAARFFLGLFEGGCIPLFSIITSNWYRRAEQPLRVAAWYGTNGLATMAAGLLSFGLGHIQSGVIHSWQVYVPSTVPVKYSRRLKVAIAFSSSLGSSPLSLHLSYTGNSTTALPVLDS